MTSSSSLLGDDSFDAEVPMKRLAASFTLLSQASKDRLACSRFSGVSPKIETNRSTLDARRNETGGSLFTVEQEHDDMPGRPRYAIQEDQLLLREIGF